VRFFSPSSQAACVSKWWMQRGRKPWKRSELLKRYVRFPP